MKLRPALTLYVSGLLEAGSYRGRVSHLIACVDPEDVDTVPHLGLPATCRLVQRFHDIYRIAEAREREREFPGSSCVAPTEGMVRKALRFAKPLTAADSLLVSCGYGISRSTAVAYSILCEAHPDEHESEMLATVLRLRPEASPNELIVSYADKILRRQGRMVKALDRLLGA